MDVWMSIKHAQYMPIVYAEVSRLYSLDTLLSQIHLCINQCDTDCDPLQQRTFNRMISVY